MSNFLTLTPSTGGVPGTAPRIFSASTSDSLEEILVSNYLSDIKSLIKNNDFFHINYIENGVQIYGQFIVTANTTLVAYPASEIGSGSDEQEEGISWQEVTSDTQMQSNTGYVITSTSLTSMILPALCPFGSRIKIIQRNDQTYQILQNENQYVVIGAGSSTVGSSGYTLSSNARCSLNLVCTLANIEFMSSGAPQGIFTNH